MRVQRTLFGLLFVSCMILGGLFLWSIASIPEKVVDDTVHIQEHDVIHELSEGMHELEDGYMFEPCDETKYVTGTELNVRDAWSKEGEILSQLFYRDAVRVTASIKDSNWVRIDLDGVVGYCSSDYLSDIRPAEPSHYASYDEILTAEAPRSIHVLVNKRFALSSGYVPSDLVDIGGGYLLRAEAAKQFQIMKKALERDGHRVYVRSAYRSYKAQISTYNGLSSKYGKESADRNVARPGHSEHQTGLAVDILQYSGSGNLTSAGFQNTAQYAWLIDHAHKYGYILRYPQGLTHMHGFVYEPWHWRYVGVGTATTMYDEGIVLFEEYYDEYLATGGN